MCLTFIWTFNHNLADQSIRSTCNSVFQINRSNCWHWNIFVSHNALSGHPLKPYSTDYYELKEITGLKSKIVILASFRTILHIFLKVASSELLESWCYSKHPIVCPWKWGMECLMWLRYDCPSLSKANIVHIIKFPQCQWIVPEEYW